MKRILFCLLLLVAVSAGAQSYDRATTVCKGTWNTYTQKWLWGETKACDMSVTFHGNTVLVADNARSAYRTGTVQERVDNAKERTTTWHATDEAGRRCYVTLSFFKERSSQALTIMYDDVCFIYTLAADDTELNNL